MSTDLLSLQHQMISAFHADGEIMFNIITQVKDDDNIEEELMIPFFYYIRWLAVEENYKPFKEEINTWLAALTNDLHECFGELLYEKQTGEIEVDTIDNIVKVWKDKCVKFESRRIAYFDRIVNIKIDEMMSLANVHELVRGKFKIVFQDSVKNLIGHQIQILKNVDSESNRFIEPENEEEWASYLQANPINFVTKSKLYYLAGYLAGIRMKKILSNCRNLVTPEIADLYSYILENNFYNRIEIDNGTAVKEISSETLRYTQVKELYGGLMFPKPELFEAIQYMFTSFYKSLNSRTCMIYHTSDRQESTKSMLLNSKFGYHLFKKTVPDGISDSKGIIPFQFIGIGLFHTSVKDLYNGVMSSVLGAKVGNSIRVELKSIENTPDILKKRKATPSSSDESKKKKLIISSSSSSSILEENEEKEEEFMSRPQQFASTTSVVACTNEIDEQEISALKLRLRNIDGLLGNEIIEDLNTMRECAEMEEEIQEHAESDDDTYTDENEG